MLFFKRPRDWLLTALVVSIFASAGLKVFGGAGTPFGFLFAVGLVVATIALMIFWGYDSLKSTYELTPSGEVVIKGKGKIFTYEPIQDILFLVKHGTKKEDQKPGEVYSYRLHIAADGEWEDFRFELTPEALDALMNGLISLGAQWLVYGPGDNIIELMGKDKAVLPFRLREPVATMGMVLAALLLVLFAGVVIQGLLIRL